MKKRLLTGLLFLMVFTATKAQDTLKYAKKQVADDIIFFLKNAAEIHANLYHDITPQLLTKRTDSLISKLSDSLSVFMALRALAEATAFINEGHTGMNTPKVIRTAVRAGALKMIPLKVTGYADEYFDAQLTLAPGNLKPVKVSAINGIAAGSIYMQMLALKGGLTSFRNVVVLGNFRYFLSVIGIGQPYRIEYMEQGKGKESITIDGITESDYAARIGKPSAEGPYTFSIEKGAYGYLNFKSMSTDYDKFVHFCDSIFEVMDHQQIKKLVVDLRENSGGNSGLGRYLINYITDKPYRMAGESKRKVSEQFKKYLIANSDVYKGYDDYLKLKNGDFLKMENDGLDKPGDMKYKFKGRVCFLIGPYTFSSANMLAATLKDFKLSTLIGEATGQPANDYGELCTINLPNTGLSGFTSTTLWVRPNNDTKDNQPILPDYVVKKTVSTKDNVLEYAVRWLDR